MLRPYLNSTYSRMFIKERFLLLAKETDNMHRFYNLLFFMVENADDQAQIRQECTKNNNSSQQRKRDAASFYVSLRIMLNDLA